jgi:hypothetical protein
MNKETSPLILEDRKERKLEEIAKITAESDAVVVMLALYHLGPKTYSQLGAYVEKPSTLYRHVAGLEKIKIIKNKKKRFILTDIGREYLKLRDITSRNPFI